ncbi:MAG: hypothetical protein OSB21_11110 [Myxococcota bacterium]|nr:hypothetical protein [Myxococcota bacterium]
MKPLSLIVTFSLLAGCPSWRSSPVSEFPGFSEIEQSKVNFVFGAAKVTYFGKKGRLKGDMGIIAAAPDQLLIEVRGPGGAPISTFACDGTTVSLYDLDGPSFYQGPATPLSMARLLPLPIEPEYASALLLGKLPMPGRIRVYENRATSQRIEGEHATLGVLRVTRHSADHWLWELPDEGLRVDFSERQSNGLFRRVLIRSKGSEVLLRFSELDSSGEAPAPDLFRLQAPAGVSVQRL